MAGILNSNITLTAFNTAFMYKGNRPADAFVHKAAKERLLLEPDTVLWKCTQYSLVNPRNGSITEWWCTADDLDPILQRCRNLHVSLRRFARARLAVKWEWNDMTDFLRARLLQPVFGFAGGTKAQDTSFGIHREPTGVPESRVAFIGGDRQFCIPFLTPAHISELSRTSAERIP